MTRLTGIAEEAEAETPEDVAILYAWANLHGAKYRDFSASRREYRAQVRQRAAEALRQAELSAQGAAEAAAAQLEEAARESERTAGKTEGAEGERALRAAEAAVQRAAAERVEAARRAEAAVQAEAVARREARAIAEARVAAQRQEEQYVQAEVRRRAQAGPQPMKAGMVEEEAQEVGGGVWADPEGSVARREEAQGSGREESAGLGAGNRRVYRPELEVRRRPQGFHPDESSGVLAAFRPAGGASEAAVVGRVRDVGAKDAVGKRGGEAAEPGGDEGKVAPAWLHGDDAVPAPGRPVAVPRPAAVAGVRQGKTEGTLQHSQERVASKWFALKGAFGGEAEEVSRDGSRAGPRDATWARRESGAEGDAPLLVVFSLAGGVGKTSLVASLGRALSSRGERVLLVDLTLQGLLPYYFGASELRTGEVRRFSPPEGSQAASIAMVSYGVEERWDEQKALLGALGRSGRGSDRMLLDVDASSADMLRKLGSARVTMLVPLAPDMNTVISLPRLERSLAQGEAEAGAVVPYYVLNGFDGSLPLHLDVREVLRGRLGDRLLPMTIRRSPAISEALAEGMTVMDYAPEAGVAEDYRKVAQWLREVSVAVAEASSKRWRER